MERSLNLIKTDAKETEKKVFPRFPFSFLTFRSVGPTAHVFEVRDLSYTGMQICLKDGGHPHKIDERIEGELRWRSGLTTKTRGIVKWMIGSRLGVAFDRDDNLKKEIQSFYSVENIAEGMQPIHERKMDIDFPANLTYWLRTDGQVEIFIWQHNNLEFAKFQLIFLRKFVEWEDGKGLRTGRVLSSRDVDTPLSTEDEFLFEIDTELDREKFDFAQKLMCFIGEDKLPEQCRIFIETKLKP